MRSPLVALEVDARCERGEPCRRRGHSDRRGQKRRNVGRRQNGRNRRRHLPGHQGCRNSPAQGRRERSNVRGVELAAAVITLILRLAGSRKAPPRRSRRRLNQAHPHLLGIRTPPDLPRCVWRGKESPSSRAGSCESSNCNRQSRIGQADPRRAGKNLTGAEKVRLLTEAPQRLRGLSSSL